MKKMLIVCCVILLSASYNAGAQDTSAVFKKAMLLLDTMKMQVTYTKTVDLIVEQQLDAEPSIAKYKKEMRAFMYKYLGWDAVKNDLAALYAKYFTSEDLDQLIIFYSTPAGQKILSVTPEITQKSMMLGQQKVQEHMDELKKIFEKDSDKAAHE